MELLDITLKGLLANPNIENFYHDGKHFFSYSDINREYQNQFQFTPSSNLLNKKPFNQRIVTVISYQDIAEQVEHVKTLPSFDERVRAMVQHKNFKK